MLGCPSGLIAVLPLPPTVTSFTPTVGTTAGGTSVVITGDNFIGATSVTFGGTTASFTVTNATSISATAPAHAAGNVVIRVTNPVGYDEGSTNFGYWTVPVVTSFSPANGTTAGGTSVVITGTGFLGTTSVKFGGTTASFSITNATSITATTPAHAAGNVAITVTNPIGSDDSSTNYNYKVPVTPGSQTFTANGTFTVPNFNTLLVECWGAGGGGAGATSGANGGNSTFNGSAVVGGGGKSSGAGGTGSGGTTNVTGGAGGAGESGTNTTSTNVSADSGAGGTGANGGAGGASVRGSGSGSANDGKNGSAPGGGGSGAAFGARSTSLPFYWYAVGYNGGGGGGYSAKTFTEGQLTVGQGYSVVVGRGGSGGPQGGVTGGAGARGQVRLTWA